MLNKPPDPTGRPRSWIGCCHRKFVVVRKPGCCNQPQQPIRLIMPSDPDNPHLDRMLRLELSRGLSQFSPAQEIELNALREDFSDVVNISDLRRDHPDLDESLSEIERYLRVVCEPPFCHDMGAGGSLAMPVRYNAASRIRAVCHPLLVALLEVLSDTHLELLEAFITDDMRLAAAAIVPRPIDLLLRTQFPEFYEFQSNAKSRPAIWRWLRIYLKRQGHAAEMLKPTDRFPDLVDDDFEILTAVEKALKRDLDDSEENQSLGLLAKFLAANLPRKGA